MPPRTLLIAGLAWCGALAAHAAPSIETFAPRGAVPGTTVQITGSGFETDSGQVELAIGATALVPASVSDTEITFIVTASTPSGPITVAVEGARATTLAPFVPLRTVAGTLRLPPGVSTAGYRVGRGIHAAPAAADGTFSAAVPRDAPQILTA